MDIIFDKDAFLEGQILLIDKPYGWTSFQALSSVRWTISKGFGIKKIKVGHAGTLDPLATGLLLLCTGRKTKQISELQGQTKEYTGTFHLGATTPSYDLETAPEGFRPIDHITEQLLRETTTDFIGEIRQKPPVFSAVKKDGKRLYQYARKGQDVEVPERTVVVTTFDLTEIALPEVRFLVRCGKGTYIRSLAHDFGQQIGTGAYLSELRRTKIGSFCVNKALTPDAFRETFHKAGLEL